MEILTEGRKGEVLRDCTIYKMHDVVGHARDPEICVLGGMGALRVAGPREDPSGLLGFNSCQKPWIFTQFHQNGYPNPE